jgi:hypothetical protein
MVVRSGRPTPASRRSLRCQGWHPISVPGTAHGFDDGGFLTELLAQQSNDDVDRVERRVDVGRGPKRRDPRSKGQEMARHLSQGHGRCCLSRSRVVPCKRSMTSSWWRQLRRRMIRACRTVPAIVQMGYKSMVHDGHGGRRPLVATGAGGVRHHTGSHWPDRPLHQAVPAHASGAGCHLFRQHHRRAPSAAERPEEPHEIARRRGAARRE